MPGDGSASKFIVHRPAAGLSVSVETRPGSVYHLDFDHGEADSYGKDGPNLELFFPDGGVLTLQGFCLATANADIILELVDGTQLSGAEVVEVLSMSLQDFHTNALLTPAAGEAAMSAGGELPRLEELLDCSGAQEQQAAVPPAPDSLALFAGEPAAPCSGGANPSPDMAAPSSASCRSDTADESLDSLLALLRDGIL
jgi:hypothetical protein